MAAQDVIVLLCLSCRFLFPLSWLTHLCDRPFSFEAHPQRGRDEYAEQHPLSRQRFHGGVDTEQRHGRWEIQRGRRYPAGCLQLIDAGAGEDESHDIEQSTGGAEKILERHAQAELEDREGRREQRDDTRSEAAEDRVVTVFVLQPERLIEKHDLESFPVHREERDADQAENTPARKHALDFVLDERLPALGLGARVQPVTDIEKRHRGENRDEAFHAFAMLTAESQHRLAASQVRTPAINARIQPKWI